MASMPPAQPPVQRLTYQAIRVQAEKFLKDYHPTNTVPVPIEDIMDLNFRINIVPVPDLCEFGVQGYTYQDMKTIVIDQYVYERQPGRYRFTLAHELGHIVMHKKFFASATYKNVEEYLTFQNSMSEEQVKWKEFQANAFAGLVLVPSAPLEKCFREQTDRIVGTGLSATEPMAREYIAESIAELFDVSSQTIQRRLVYDSHWAKPSSKS